jgi:hypothetical protein
MRVAKPKTIQQYVWAKPELVQTVSLGRTTPESTKATAARTETNLQLHQCTATHV